MIIFVNSTKNTTEIKAANTAKNLNEAIEQTCFFFMSTCFHAKTRAELG